MKLRLEELKKGEVYLAAFPHNDAIIFRFETRVRSHVYYFSAVKIDGTATDYFRSNDYYNTDNMTDLRPATEAEKTKLVKYEAENDVEYREKAPTGAPLTAERLPDDFKKINEHRYEKKIENNLILGVGIPDRFVYIAPANHNDIQKSWEEATEEKLQEIYKIFTGKEIEFKELELEKEISPLEELYDYVISLEKRIIQLESNA